MYTKSPLQYFTSGGGSKAWRGGYTPNSDKLQFFYDGQGFMLLKFTRSDADVVFYDVAGQELYKWSMTKVNQDACSRNVAM
jgi:tartrate-resistant acid phosphatase type 5